MMQIIYAEHSGAQTVYLGVVHIIVSRPFFFLDMPQRGIVKRIYQNTQCFVIIYLFFCRRFEPSSPRTAFLFILAPCRTHSLCYESCTMLSRWWSLSCNFGFQGVFLSFYFFQPFLPFCFHVCPPCFLMVLLCPYL